MVFRVVFLAYVAGAADLMFRGEELNLVVVAFLLTPFLAGMVTKNAKFHGAFALLNLLYGIFILFAGEVGSKGV